MSAEKSAVLSGEIEPNGLSGNRFVCTVSATLVVPTSFSWSVPSFHSHRPGISGGLWNPSLANGLARMKTEMNISELPRTVLMGLVRGYQYFISPILPPSCRFIPSCSTYTLQAIEKYGAFRGAWMGLCRILRCHPFSRGGYDPVR